MPLYRYYAEGFSQVDGVLRAVNKEEALSLAQSEAACEIDIIDKLDVERVPKMEELDIEEYSYIAEK